MNKTASKNPIVTTLDKEWSNMSLGRLTAKNIDFFVAILSLYQRNPLQEMRIPFNTLKQLTFVADENNNIVIREDRPAEVKKHLMKLGKDLVGIYQEYHNEDADGLKPIFIDYSIPKDKDELHIKWHPDIIPMIEHLTKNAIYIKKDVFRLSSAYSKCLYIMLREFDNEKSVFYDSKYSHKVEITIPLDKLHDRLGTPMSYRKGTANLWHKVLNKANIGELERIFSDLTVTSVKSEKIANKVTAIRFSWKPSTMVLDEQQKMAIEYKKQGTYKQTKSKNQFHNFNQRDYDLDAIVEQRLINRLNKTNEES